MNGRIVVLNGAPRAGKTSIVRAMQESPGGNWVNLGVDQAMRTLPPQLLPGIGLRPGGERPDLEAVIPRLYLAAYDTIAAHAHQGFDVVADFGHHDSYSKPLGILQACARRVTGLNVWFVGVRCPLEITMARRNADPQNGFYLAGEGVPPPVQRWQDAVHTPGIYDLELDTGALTPEQCAGRIREALEAQALPTAFRRLAAL